MATLTDRAQNIQPVCKKCTTSTTRLWRRDEMGSVLCNACGLFLKLHGTPRPISLKTDVIKSRNRVKTAGQGQKRKVGIPTLFAELIGAYYLNHSSTEMAYQLRSQRPKHHHQTNHTTDKYPIKHHQAVLIAPTPRSPVPKLLPSTILPISHPNTSSTAFPSMTTPFTPPLYPHSNYAIPPQAPPHPSTTATLNPHIHTKASSRPTPPSKPASPN